MPDLPETAQKLVARLIRGTLISDWAISVTVDPDTPDPANIEPDHDLKRARIKLNPEYQRLVPGTLDELIAHELGHLFTDDVFSFLKPTVAAKEAEERIASRIGILLLNR